MQKLKEAIHTALRDDSTATVGLRTLLGHAATPYGVYFGHFPETPDFSSKHYLTWYLLPAGAAAAPQTETKLREQAFRVTAWSTSPDTVESILKRARWRLENLKGVTVPTEDVELHAIKFEASSGDLFDDDRKVHYKADQFRAYYREDVAWA